VWAHNTMGLSIHLFNFFFYYFFFKKKKKKKKACVVRFSDAREN
jgi:hypothetical protein